MIDFTKTNGGGGSFSEASLSYPTGGEALTDPALYSYIKGLYDNGVTVLDNSYTIVGSPTITEKGIASGFSTTNKLQISTINSGNNSFNVVGSFTSTATQITPARVLDSNTTGVTLMISADNVRIAWSVHSNGVEFFERRFDYDVINNTEYFYKISYVASEGKYYLYLGTDKDNLTEMDSVSANAIGNQNWALVLGAYSDTSLDRSFIGNINLNYFKIDINNIVAFQGKYLTCKQTSTGSKIVDVSNKDIVDEIFGLSGSAPYFVIDTANETVTLPKGDLFGFITQALN